jgi:hypothetical protein
MLLEIRGKEAYVALDEISRVHPDERSRPWLSMHAKSKAEIDADLNPWSEAQVREFHECQERTPSNHRELFELALMRLLDLKADLEDGDSSDAPMLVGVLGKKSEATIRTYIGNWCRNGARGRYSIPQEEELADAKRLDLRFHGVGFDAPVPVELKLADNWTGPQLFERLEVQLCGDYLRDRRSSRGIYLMVYRGERAGWMLPGTTQCVGFGEFTIALERRWRDISAAFPMIEEIHVLGIDLTRRAE